MASLPPSPFARGGEGLGATQMEGDSDDDGDVECASPASATAMQGYEVR